MAIYRNIHLSFWTDNKIEDNFTPEDKYFYLYLMTNPQTNICGCYEYSYSQISRHTGYSKDTIIRLLERFQDYHKVIRYDKETKEILLLKWYKYNWSKSEKTLTGVENVAKYIKSDFLRNQVFSIIKHIRNDEPVVLEPENDNELLISTDKHEPLSAEDLFSEFNISDSLSYAINDWIGYKKERHFSYKDRGLKTLIKTISENAKKYGDDSVIKAINESISSGYQGIVFDKIGRNRNYPNNGIDWSSV